MATSIVLTSCLFCKDHAADFLPLTPLSRPGRDLTGSRFERLTVSHALGTKNHKLYWCCLCDCGTSRLVHSHALTTRQTQSCGCLMRENPHKRTHGHSHTPLYRRWLAMWRRCTKPYDAGFVRYGARGITVCDRWRDFANFYADMGEPPQGMSIERRDNNQGYSPENCYWAPQEVQANNTRSNRYFTYNNATHTLAEWSRIIQQPLRRLQARLALGWDIARILTTPGDTRYDHPGSHLTALDVQHIRRRRRQGEGGAALAREYGVSQSCISDIMAQRTYTWVKDEPV